MIDSFEDVAGLPLARWKIVSSMDDLSAFGFPMYLKADVSGHKSEMGAVQRCGDLDEACVKLKKMHKKFSDKRIVVQESISDCVEMIVGLKHDEVFGIVLVVVVMSFLE